MFLKNSLHNYRRTVITILNFNINQTSEIHCQSNEFPYSSFHGEERLAQSHPPHFPGCLVSKSILKSIFKS